MISKLKKELFHLRKAFFVYKKGFSYIWYKYFFLHKIFNSGKTLDKNITHQNFSIHLLTSHQDFSMLAWALASFYNSSDVIGEVYIHSDGTLKSSDVEKLKKIFPSIKIVDSGVFVEEFSNQLDNYPVLKKFRSKYNNFSFKKIIDPYFVSSKDFRLILDSDVLWFKSSAAIKKVIDGETDKSFMQKNNTAIEVSFKNNLKLDTDLQHANAGIILYKKNNFDLDKFSEFLNNLDEDRAENLHFADQAGHAYCLQNLEFLPDGEYVIKGGVSDNVVAKHYTGPRRAQFYFEGLEIIKNNLDL